MSDTNLNEALETVKEALLLLPAPYTAELAGRALSQIEARLGELEKEQRALRDWYDESPMKEWPDD